MAKKASTPSLSPVRPLRKPVQGLKSSPKKTPKTLVKQAKGAKVAKAPKITSPCAKTPRNQLKALSVGAADLLAGVPGRYPNHPREYTCIRYTKVMLDDFPAPAVHHCGNDATRMSKMIAMLAAFDQDSGYRKSPRLLIRKSSRVAAHTLRVDWLDKSRVGSGTNSNMLAQKHFILDFS